MSRSRASICLLLFFILGSCKNGSDSSVAFTSTEDEYQAGSDLLIDKELRIYGPGVSPQERNRLLLELTQERIRLVCHHAPTSPSALDDMVRSSSIIPRQKLLEVYKSLTPGMQKTYLGKAIHVISDLKGTEGPLDRKLCIHGIPTYYYTDREGHVRRILGGFDEQLFTSSTGLSPKWGENWTEEIGIQ